jgi:hypothetical protein
MNSQQIDKILSQILKNKFKGVKASNSPFNFSNNYPYGFVVNTDPLGKPGQHWQGIWCKDQEHVEFFDSYGIEPKGHIKKFLEKFLHLKKNKTKLQDHLEISCGPYVIYFLIKRFLGISFENIINSLASKKFNDSYVKLFVYNLTELK